MSLTIVDISDPANPTFVGVVTDGTALNGAQGINVSGKFAYIVSSAGTAFAVVDVSDPTNPTVIDSIVDVTTLEGVDDVHVSGQFAYVTATAHNSLSIIDISDPTDVSIISGHPPEACFFTDDRPENVDGARRFGIDAELFTGVPSLLRSLRARGIEV